MPPGHSEESMNETPKTALLVKDIEANEALNP
jgi:hypothetical protein